MEQKKSSSTFFAKCAHFPMRLNQKERVYLEILQGALDTSEYTDNVDIVSYYRKDKTIKKEIEELLSIISGLMLASNFRLGENLIAGNCLADNEAFFQNVFEVGRRYKISNVDKMRSVYGKMMHMLQDASSARMQDMTGVTLNCDMKTIESVLKEGQCEALLKDDRLSVATKPSSSEKHKSRAEIDEQIKAKMKARNELCEEFSKSSSLSKDSILLCLESIDDARTNLFQNCRPVERMIEMLTSMFSPDKEEEGFSLAISSGRGGACFSHSHSDQYTFVLQTLVLWREIMTNMFELWRATESDLLGNGGHYRLCQTGQGLNRVQSAPRVAAIMSRILGKVKSEVREPSSATTTSSWPSWRRGSGREWIGLSVVHLGDRDVPNALVFIDKYTQVPRILGPIVQTLDSIDRLGNENEKLNDYIKREFGSNERCRQVIMRDFVRHGFDGSGDDGGSCIDGRLTSAWNWCSKISKKSFYPVFLLSGFIGFDGDFRR